MTTDRTTDDLVAGEHITNDGPLDLIDAVAQLSFEMLDLLTRCAAEHDLSSTQLRLLGILRDRTPTMASLAEHLRLDRSSITGLIDRAEKRGLVARLPSTKDARVTMVELTPTGRTTAAAVQTTVDRAVTTLTAGTAPKDRQAVIRFAETIISRA